MSSGLGFGRSTSARLDVAATHGYGPGWRRMVAQQQNKSENSWQPGNNATDFSAGDRVFHQKFGMGTVKRSDGDKLEIAFDKAGEKKVISRFVRQL